MGKSIPSSKQTGKSADTGSARSEPKFWPGQGEVGGGGSGAQGLKREESSQSLSEGWS